MIKISSIIIAKNEESNIKRCIESQLNCIDEIIVLVDKESADGTLEIVRSFSNVKYEICEWKGYAATKQYGLTLASSDWILWIDADEAITSELRNELNEFKSSTPLNAAYSVPRKAYFLGRWIKHSGWYPGRVVRLFNKNSAGFNENSVHEGLIVKGTAGKLKYDLDHYTDPSIKHYFEKFNNYTSLAAGELFDKGSKSKLTDILVRPSFLFFKMYILKAGFLDGLQGFILSVFSSAYVFTKYCKLWELNKKRV